MEKIVIMWEVSDGYVGDYGLHKTVIDVEAHIMSEAEWGKLTENEREAIISQAIQEDFQQKVSWQIINRSDKKPN